MTAGTPFQLFSLFFFGDIIGAVRAIRCAERIYVLWIKWKIGKLSACLCLLHLDCVEIELRKNNA